MTHIHILIMGAPTLLTLICTLGTLLGLIPAEAAALAVVASMIAILTCGAHWLVRALRHGNGQ